MIHRFLSAAAAVLLCCSCTFLVRSMIDEKADAVTDVTEDVGEPEPDFNPENCAFWGSIYPEDPEALAINRSDTNLNGSGDLVLTVAAFGVTPLYHVENEVSIVGGHYYCVPVEDVDGFADAVVFMSLIDFSQSLQGNYFVDKSLISSPVDYTLAIGYAYGLVTNPGLALHFWNGTGGARMDIAASYRVSRFEGKAVFSSNFPPGQTAGLNPRLCVYPVAASGLSEPGYENVTIGSRVNDVLDSAAVADGEWDFWVNIAAQPDQEFYVYLEYVEHRDRFGDDQPCGSDVEPKYCVIRALTMDPGSIGGVMVDPVPYGIEPITGPCE
jgi:hypothetical protein